LVNDLPYCKHNNIHGYKFKGEVFGHWEADTIIGKAHKGVIVTLDERISKLRLA
jgi:IS30 family transposase